MAVIAMPAKHAANHTLFPRPNLSLPSAQWPTQQYIYTDIEHNLTVTQALTETQKKTWTQRHTDRQTCKTVDWRLGTKRLTCDTGTDWLKKMIKRTTKPQSRQNVMGTSKWPRHGTGQSYRQELNDTGVAQTWHWTTQGNTKGIAVFPPKPTPSTYTSSYVREAIVFPCN